MTDIHDQIIVGNGLLSLIAGFDSLTQVEGGGSKLQMPILFL